MRIFSSKKSSAAAPAQDGSYEAPTAPSPAPHASSSASASTASAAPASATATVSKLDQDIEKALSTGQPTNINEKSANLKFVSEDGDSTVKSTDDTRTYRTDYSAPTLRTVDSMDTKDSAFTITKHGEYLTMNGFANGHLMRWKFAAEEGPGIIRFPALLLGLTVIGTTLYPIVSDEEFWTVANIICATHTCVFASLILVLEGRVITGNRGPTNCRARIRAAVTRYINLLRLLWGRGLLYIFVGTLNITIDHPYAFYSGCALVLFGIIAIFAGAHASYNLDKMKTSLTDEAYLWSRFDAYDSDKDNHVDIDAFAELLCNLGLEFDDAYTFKAFSQISGDAKGKITFEQFRDWWIVTQNRGRTLRNTSDGY